MYKWVFDSLEVLSGFFTQVVVLRRPSSPLVVKNPQTQSSQILVEPHLVDAEFRKAWMPFFCSLVILLSLLISSWILLVIFCLRSLVLDFPRITGRDLQEVARLRSLLLVV